MPLEALLNNCVALDIFTLQSHSALSCVCGGTRLFSADFVPDISAPTLFDTVMRVWALPSSTLLNILYSTWTHLCRARLLKRSLRNLLSRVPIRGFKDTGVRGRLKASRTSLTCLGEIGRRHNATGSYEVNCVESMCLFPEILDGRTWTRTMCRVASLLAKFPAHSSQQLSVLQGVLHLHPLFWKAPDATP